MNRLHSESRSPDKSGTPRHGDNRRGSRLQADRGSARRVSRHGRTDAAGSIARESNHPRHAGFLRFSYRYNASAAPRRNASPKNFFPVHVLGDPVPLGMHQHEQGSQHGRGGDVGEMKSATASADEREDNKERKNDEV